MNAYMYMQQRGPTQHTACPAAGHYSLAGKAKINWGCSLKCIFLQERKPLNEMFSFEWEIHHY